MKRTLIVIVLLALLTVPAVAAPRSVPSAPLACTGLFFSEYIEGSSNNKALEIFNGAGAAIDLSAGSYKVEMYFNGNTSVGLTINLIGTVTAGDVYVLAHGSANAAILAQADQTSGASFYNGDDAVVLKQGSTIIDVIGQIGFDPGTEWGAGLTSTTDNTLRRKSSVSTGDKNGSDTFDPATEWDGYATDTFGGLGSHTATCSGGPVNQPVVPICPTSLNAVVGNATSGPVSASDSDGTVITAAVTSGGAAGITLDGVTPAGSVGGTLTGTLNVAATTAVGSYNVTLTFTNADSPTPQTATCTVPMTISPVGGACPPAALTPIYTIQGSGATSPLVGNAVTFNGIVTGDFQGATELSGFFVQDESGDSNVATSDGIFVYDPAVKIDVAVGDRVQVRGTVKEYNSLTEIDTVTNVTLCSAATPIAPLALDLPVAINGDQERYEGMLVTISETLIAAQNFFEGRYGQITLSADGRMFNPTNGNGLGDTADYDARRSFALDDGSSSQNPNPIPHIGADNTQRAGDTVAGVTGVWSQGAINASAGVGYILQPTHPVTFTRANPRTAAPDSVGGNIKVASFNVLNYFTTWGCGDACRGANDATEFARQRTKIIAAIQAINADVVGLMEIENNGATAVGNLVSGLNDALGADTYAYVAEPAPGSDAIKVAMIYKPGTLIAPTGAAQNYQVTTNPTYNPLFDRPPLAQTFTVIGTGEKFTVMVNHFKSKGSCPTSGVDLDSGQGCWNVKRVAQATGLLDFITQLQTSSGDLDVLVIGDLNAYGAEDPINTLVAGGLVNQVAQIPAAQRYSYVFDGLAGYLDQGLATAALNTQVNGVTIWHINADEPSVIDYNTEFKPQDLYTSTPYRASDHDPVVVGLNLCQAAGAATGLSIARSGTNDVTLTWPAVPNAATYSLWRDTSPYFTPTGSPIAVVGASPHSDGGRTGDPATNYYYVVTAVNACGQTSGVSNRVGEFDFALTPGQ